MQIHMIRQRESGLKLARDGATIALSSKFYDQHFVYYLAVYYSQVWLYLATNFLDIIDDSEM